MHKLFHRFNRPGPRLPVWSILGLVLLFNWRSAAQTNLIVTNASLVDLQNAMANGGTVILDFSGTIVIPAPLTILVDTTLNAGTNSVTLSGGGSARIFNVASNINLTLLNLTVSGGTNAGASGLTGTTGASNLNVGSNGGAGGAGATALGGAIYNQGFSSAVNCVFLNNTAIGGNGGNGGGGGGGAFQAGNGGNGGDGGHGYGGAIYNLGTLLLSNCAFSGNTAIGGNGGAAGTNGAGGFSIAGTGGSGAEAAGAGLYNLGVATIVNCTFSDNFSQGGGSQAALGLANNGDGADGRPGAPAEGGAIFNLGTNTIINSTFYFNLAGGGSGGSGGNTSIGFAGGGAGNGGNAYGGGLYNGGAGSVSVINCTFAGGVVDGGTNGVAGTGAFAGGAGSPGGSYGANIANAGGVLKLQNTILAYPTNGANAYGPVQDLDNNISTDGSPVFTQTNSFDNLDPALEPLATNGGPTMTMALTLGSPAINAIYDSSAPGFDQRGAPRPFGPRSDMGAYEFGAVVPVVVATTSQATAAIAVVTNSVQLSFLGVANLNYRIQASTDLLNWLDLATDSSGTNGQFFYADSTTNFVQRFYRAVTP